MTYVLELPDAPFLTPNSRAHWSKRSRYGRAWRDTTKVLAIASRLPTCQHVHVALEMHPRDRRRRDADNLVSGVLKHVLDGLVDAGVIPDDTPHHVTAAMPRIVPPEGALRPRAHRWLVHVTPTEPNAKENL